MPTAECQQQNASPPTQSGQGAQHKPPCGHGFDPGRRAVAVHLDAVVLRLLARHLVERDDVRGPVKKSDNQTIRPSDHQAIRQSGNQTIGQSDNQTIGQSDNRTIHTIGQSDNRAITQSVEVAAPPGRAR
eukprot:297451-Prymnesium_polylepis.1